LIFFDNLIIEGLVVEAGNHTVFIAASRTEGDHQCNNKQQKQTALFFTLNSPPTTKQIRDIIGWNITLYRTELSPNFPILNTTTTTTTAAATSAITNDKQRNNSLLLHQLSLLLKQQLDFYQALPARCSVIYLCYDTANDE
jgi:hypothetical protein